MTYLIQVYSCPLAFMLRKYCRSTPTFKTMARLTIHPFFPSTLILDVSSCLLFFFFFFKNFNFCEVFDLMSASLITLVLAVTALAAPAPVTCSCDISDVQLALPANRTAFSTPTSPLSSLVLGIGFQNYSCSTAGTYT